VGNLELRISQHELARFLGVTRQAVNHNLSEWRRLGWIDLGRNQIVIRNTDALRAFIAATIGA
jgi:CRP-like cAMP-binding protein